jgi:plastocyanin
VTSGALIILYIVLGLGAVASLILFGFPILLASTSPFHGSSHAPSPFSEVYIPQNASHTDSPKNFEPSTTSVVIGLNNRVIWTNYEITKVSVVADDNSDPGFFAATHEGTSNNPTHESLLNSYETFEYTFTEQGKYGYHCSIHPWMKGTVIVLPSDQTLRNNAT